MKFGEIFERERKREDGAWIRDGFSDLPGIALKVRGLGCSLQEQKAKEFWDRATPEDRASSDVDVRSQIYVLSEATLVDWQIEDKPYSKEAACEALGTKIFRDAVAWAAGEVASRGLSNIEADKGN